MARQDRDATDKRPVTPPAPAPRSAPSDARDDRVPPTPAASEPRPADREANHPGSREVPEEKPGLPGRRRKRG
jgi:hypothetical protein